MFRNGLQIQHIMLLVLIVLVLFGANKLPDVARNVGKSMKILKEEAKELRGGDSDEPAAESPAASDATADARPADVTDTTPATPPGEAGQSGR